MWHTVLSYSKITIYGTPWSLMAHVRWCYMAHVWCSNRLETAKSTVNTGYHINTLLIFAKIRGRYHSIRYSPERAIDTIPLWWIVFHHSQKYAVDTIPSVIHPKASSIPFHYSFFKEALLHCTYAAEKSTCYMKEKPWFFAAARRTKWLLARCHLCKDTLWGERRQKIIC